MAPEPARAVWGPSRRGSAVLEETILRLLEYCRANDWAGYDPYDALNSRLFKALPFLDFRIARLALTQGVKRCPVNLRPLLLIPRSVSPKGVALFLSAAVRLAKSGFPRAEDLVDPLADKLLSMRSPGLKTACWGYNFDWQQRSALVPKGSPNIICTTFAANALLDAYQLRGRTAWLAEAVGAAEFILQTLFWRENGLVACFSYTPIERTRIHNANLLGAALLTRVARVTGDGRMTGPALEAARYSAGCQRADGAWPYGEADNQHWIDNFHTGFDLVALRQVRACADTAEFDDAIRRGFDFYRGRFFRQDGAPRYYHDQTFPIDIHGAAQSIITLVELEDLAGGSRELAESVLAWTMGNLWSPRGYFYYQKRPNLTVRIPFIRWSEAWMLLALSVLRLRYYAPPANSFIMGES